PACRAGVPRRSCAATASGSRARRGSAPPAPSEDRGAWRRRRGRARDGDGGSRRSTEEGLVANLPLAIDAARFQLAFELLDHGAVTDEVEDGTMEGRQLGEHRLRDPAGSPAPAARVAGDEDLDLETVAAALQVGELVEPEEIVGVAIAPEQLDAAAL